VTSIILVKIHRFVDRQKALSKRVFLSINDNVMRIKEKQQNRRMATTASTMSSCRIKTTIGVIGSLGVCIFIYLCQTLRSQPLFPFQNDSLGMCIVI